MKFAYKTVTGALAAALLTTAVASPAEAQRYRRDYHRGNGISLGDVVLGTIAVAGVATAIGAISSANRGHRRYDDRYGNRGHGDDQRVAVRSPDLRPGGAGTHTDGDAHRAHPLRRRPPRTIMRPGTGSAPRDVS